jgi:hypothetical protein
MDFDEPQLLVHVARHLGEEVRAIGIAELGGLVDIGSDGLTKPKLFERRPERALLAGRSRLPLAAKPRIC